MLRRLNTIKDCTLAATDGDIGSARDIFFDAENWTVRYLVVNTSGWLLGREVLIAPRSLGVVDAINKRIPTSLSRDQVRRSPEIDTALPITRKQEADYHRYFGWPVYWSGVGVPYPPEESTAEGVRARAAADSYPQSEDVSSNQESDTHLRSARDVERYRIGARDGEIGHVEEFLIDSGDWQIRYLVIDTRNWWPGKKVVVPTLAFDRVDWLNRTVTVNLTRDEIKSAPEFGPTAFDEGYEENLQRYYGDLSTLARGAHRGALR